MGCQDESSPLFARGCNDGAARACARNVTNSALGAALSGNLRAQLRDIGLVQGAPMVLRDLFELLGVSRRYALRMLMRRHTTSGQQGDGYPYVDNNAYPPGRSLEEYPGRLERPSDHLDPEPYLLSGLFPGELRIFARAWSQASCGGLIEVFLAGCGAAGWPEASRRQTASSAAVGRPPGTRNH